LKASIIPPGIEFPDLETSTNKPAVWTICAPGRLTLLKGMVDAITVAGHISTDGPVRLLLSSRRHAHNGGLEWYLKDLHRSAATFPQLRLEFFDDDQEQPRDPLPHLYRQAHLTLCLPEAEEGFGLIPLESLASGRPVVAAPKGGMSWVIDHGGVAVLPRDLVGVAESAYQVLTNWPEWVGRARHERTLLARHYDAAVVRASYQKAFRGLV
jgi:glycosyltransferase involved in cell wall biosynthesis